jgi:hypothetical protein
MLNAGGTFLDRKSREEMTFWAEDMKKSLLNHVSSGENPWGHRQGQ